MEQLTEMTKFYSYNQIPTSNC